ncbi:hypothetical protein PT974_08695 [Cladobotryum mycophilum]|uniref:DNA replication regulator Sld3 C-terminal domain-containing protein n=1 Tax=Cladobotryum mycophilum TaxID=491253 RepID=A0ABR0SE21_9HYPO
MSSSALLGAAENASRRQSGSGSGSGGILTPSTEGTLNRQNGPPSSEGRKRKRESSVAMEHLLKPVIAIKVGTPINIFLPHPPNLHVPPRALHPLMLLPRESLPLACIDCTGSGGDFHQSRFFEAHIRILDLESRVGTAAVVLIARYESRGTTYALERQENGLYVICKLGAWVDLDNLAKNATAVAHERLYPAKPERRDYAGIDKLTTPQLHHDQKKKRAAIEAIQSMMKKRARSVSASFDGAAKREPTVDPDTSMLSQIPSPEIKPEDPLMLQTKEKEADRTITAVPPEEQEQGPQHTADNIFDNIRTHYFDALYKSMGSLAYFAKGPLSRARSAFHLDLEANLDMNDLIDFLKSLILTTVQIDKKYREAMPEVVSKMKDHIESSDEGHRKKRKPKKMKLGKDGLYPMEDERIQKWWIANKPELHDDETGISTSQIKSHISILRTRETQLQMIVIMEILALEPLKVAGDPGDGNLPTLPGAADTQDQCATPQQPKKRNKHNLPVLLDVHADRLTIWQSTASDEQILLEDTQSARVSLEGMNEKAASSEPLKDFCVDVIVPFFSARLPELCDSINRKLGGPAIIAPAKSKSKRPPTRDQKPGSATKRPTPQNSRRTLQRALSTDQQNRRSVSRGPSNAIALLRSATSTTIPNVKRENVDSPLLRTMQSSESLKRASSLSRSSSMSNLHDFKTNKKAVVEAELKDAISALRKPNRGVVGKAMAEADERRSSTNLAVKKTRKPVRPSATSNVQVKATPANNRFKNMMPEKSAASQGMFVESIVDFIPPSSVGTSFIQSTQQRTSHRDMFQRSPSPEEAVGDTPIKQPVFIRRPVDELPAIRSSSPVMERRQVSSDDLVPGSVIKKTYKSHTTTFTEDDISATPIKKPTQRLIFGEKEKKVSIYAKLGWDDELDDLL